MAISKPNKKKIYILISRLSAMANTYIDSNADGGIYDASMQCAFPLIPYMDANLKDISVNQAVAFSCAEDFSDALDPSAPVQPPDMASLYSGLSAAMANFNS